MIDDNLTVQFDSTIEALRDGKCCVLPDGSEGAVLFFAAQSATAAQLAFAIRYSSGLVHAAVFSDRLDELRIPDQPIFASEDCGTGFTVAVDALLVGTGISGHDRALTLRTLADPSTVQQDLRRPGHVLPIRCPDVPNAGRPGACEVALGLVVRAGLAPVAGVCRLVHDSGDVLNDSAAVIFAADHALTVAPRVQERLMLEGSGAYLS